MSEYNGYSSRETYDVVLWCKNDESLYDLFKNQSAQTIKAEFQDWQQQLIDSPEELTQELRSVLIDIGSLWRVDWHQVSDALADQQDTEKELT